MRFIRVAIFTVLSIFSSTNPAKAARSNTVEIENRVREYHGNLGPWAVAGYLIGERALRELNVPRYSFDLEVNHQSPKQVQFSCMMDGLQGATGASSGKLNLSHEVVDVSHLATTVKNRRTGKVLVFTLKPEFMQSILNLPYSELAEAAKRVMQLEDSQIFDMSEMAHN